MMMNPDSTKHIDGMLLNMKIVDSEKTYSLKLKGKNKSWSIPIIATEEDVKVWRKDGLEVVEIVEDK